MGEVVQPGTYSLSSFATVFHALYRAGGVSDIGSLRNVQLVRNGKNIATIDVYQFIMKGNIQDDIRLQEGDVVIVPAYDVLVKIDGKVKRPMRFEMKRMRVYPLLSAMPVALKPTPTLVPCVSYARMDRNMK